MAEQVKEELTNQQDQVQDNTPEKEEENVDDYFNPFVDIKDDEEVVEDGADDKEDDVEEGKEKVVPEVDRETKQQLTEVQATLQAQKDVSKFIREKPEYAEFAEELMETTAKAIAKGYSKPVEFALRNIKSPDFWMDWARKEALADAENVLKSRVGGSSRSKSGGGDVDVSAMNSKDFEAYVNKIKNS